MRRKTRRIRAGFTLVEVALVLVIVAVLAAIAAPSLFGMIEAGAQTNRMNIARTIYLAAQDQLTQLRLSGGLKEAQKEFYENGEPRDWTLREARDSQAKLLYTYGPVYDKCGGSIPAPASDLDEDLEPKRAVQFISKPPGTHPAGIMGTLLHQIILDGATLYDGAILIEYNVETGVVLSVFYGDWQEKAFDYINDDDSTNPYKSGILGGRGMEAYGGDAKDRRQGYYGVDRTGKLDLTGKVFASMIDTYLAEDNPSFRLPNDLPVSSLNRFNKNTLFVDMYISKTWVKQNGDGMMFTLHMKNKDGNIDPVGFYPHLDDEPTIIFPSSMISYYFYKSEECDEDVIRLVFILDHIREDTINPNNLIGYLRSDYVDREYDINWKSDIEVELIGDNGIKQENNPPSRGHPYYATGTSYTTGHFTVHSARHLYNIRDVNDGNFTLGSDIRLDNILGTSRITNFRPIPSFSGTFNGNGKEIRNLHIDNSSNTGLNAGLNAGLFEVIDKPTRPEDVPANKAQVRNIVFTDPYIYNSKGGNAGVLCGDLRGGTTVANITIEKTMDKPIENETVITTGSDAGALCGTNGGAISDLILINPYITSALNAGAVCGTNGKTVIDVGTITSVYVKYDNRAYDRAYGITGTSPSSSDVGGIAGVNTGEIDGVTFISPLAEEHIAGAVAGGIAGKNSGEIRNALFLALAPINSDGEICPIVGKDDDTGTVEKETVYYLCGDPVRPDKDELDDKLPGRKGYNREPDNGFGTKLDTYGIYDTAALAALKYQSINYWFKYNNEIIPPPRELQGLYSHSPHNTQKLEKQNVSPPDDPEYLPIYPYPFLTTWASAGTIPVDPAWPIAEDDNDTLLYYEVYEDEDGTISYWLWGYFDGADGVEEINVNAPSDAKILEDGYLLLTNAERSEFKLDETRLPPKAIDDAIKAIEEFEYEYSGSLVLDIAAYFEADIAPVELENAGWFNPLFARAIFTKEDMESITDFKNHTYAVRSPRHLYHIGNDGLTLAGKFNQERGIDFDGVNTDGGYSYPTIEIPTDRAIVSGEFTGTYNGGEIRNLTIDSPGDDVGLFAVNNGTINNVTMTGADISGQNNVGGVAGINRRSIQNVTIDNTQVSGGSYVGGVAGSSEGNNGSIQTVTIDNTQVSGGSHVGGVAGSNKGNGSIQGTAQTVTIDNTQVSGESYVGGVAGSNEGNGTIQTVTAVNLQVSCGSYVDGVFAGGAYAGGIAGSNESSSNGAIYRCSVRAARVEGGTFVGGLVGSHTAGRISESFIGMISGVRDGDAYNQVIGNMSVGGIAGFSLGQINICFVDFTRVGNPDDSAGPSTNVGGAVGHMNGGSVTNVFYNYGDATLGNENVPPDHNFQRVRFVQTIYGNPDNTGGLAGWIQSGTLSNAYTDAFFSTGLNILVGRKNDPQALPSNVLYIREPKYNNVTASYTTALNNNGRTVDQLRTAAALLGGAWANGSHWDANTHIIPTLYTYPRLAGLEEPEMWPMPGLDIILFEYYEIYEKPNYNNLDEAGNPIVNNEGKYYGFYGGEVDTLDYSEDQIILEDGYILAGFSGTGNYRYYVYDINHTLIESVTTGPVQNLDPVPRLGIPQGKGVVLILNNYEDYMTGSSTQSYRGVCPLYISVSSSVGSDDGGTLAKAYVNPLFAKGVYTPNQLDEFGSTAAARAAYFQNTHKHIIRTPRHLNNIRRHANTLSANYLQEIDVNFYRLNSTGGYWKNNNVRNPGNVQNPARENLDIRTSVMPGIFTGTYTAASRYTAGGIHTGGGQYIKSIKNIGVNPGANGSVTGVSGSVGVFSRIGEGGVVENLILKNNIISGSNGPAGGLAGMNEGEIRNATSENCVVRVGSATPGIAGGLVGDNRGTIDKATVRESRTGAERPASNVEAGAGSNCAGGGVAGDNTGAVTDATVDGITVTGSTNIGGVAGANRAGGLIEQCKVTDVKVTGTADNAGGVTGDNAGTVTDVKAEGVAVTGTTGIGGVAGVNRAGGLIELCQVIDTTVTGTAKAGGVAGDNAGTLRDGFFLSTAGLDDIPVRGDNAGITGNTVGGIAGTTSTAIERMLYLAPAPTISVQSGDKTRLYYYPIRGNIRCGPSCDVDCCKPKDCFYLHGNQYTFEDNAKREEWIQGIYNRPFDPNLRPEDGDAPLVRGGGSKLFTSFFDIPFIEDMMFEERILSEHDWQQHSIWDERKTANLQYPYPVLKTMSESDAPKRWPVSFGPVREDQLDYADWGVEINRNSVGILDFINGDFNLPLINPNSKQEYPLLNPGNSSNLNDASTTDANRGGWNTDVGSCLGLNRNSTWGWFFLYHHQEWVQGWNTRPVNPIDYNHVPPPGFCPNCNNSNCGNEYWYAIEFQRPRNDGHEGRARTDYKGGQGGVYAELNADVSGTLFQTLNTIPGTQTYYSFYHTTRTSYGRNQASTHASNSATLADADKMTFYLSSMTPSGSHTGGYAYVDANGNILTAQRPTPIRPCITPRNQNTNTTAASSPAARRSVVYGTISGGNDAAKTITPAPTEFYDPAAGRVRTASEGCYLYDVWVSGLGYGVTYWSTTLHTIGTGATQIPPAGVANLSDLNNRGYAANRVIGYWHVADFGSGTTPRYSEWKQYYGLYTIPENQTITEFAFESNTNRPQHGNYLAGVSFKAPGFVAVDKYIKAGDGASAKNAKFVKPSDEEFLTVELHLTNYGEVAATNIQIIDPITPYDAYIDYVQGSCSVAGAVYNNGVLTIPAGSIPAIDPVTKARSTTVITFKIRVRHFLYDDMQRAKTLQYYFRNQARITYYDADTAYSGCRAPYTDQVESRKKENASPKEAIQVFIDPVKLTKTITPLVGESFNVTLTLEDTTDTTVDAKGMLTITLPPGFTPVNLPDGAAETQLPGGFTRIVISNVNLTDPDEKEKTFEYGVEYTGDDFGIAYDSISASYRYIFFDDETIGERGDPVPVLLEAEQTVVGLLVKPPEMDLLIAAEELTPYSSGQPGSKLFGFFEDFLIRCMIDEGGYELKPEVVLWENITEKATRNANGNYEVRIDGHIIELLQGSDNICQLVVTPRPTGGPDADSRYEYGDGDIELFYSVELVATKPGSADIDISSAPQKIAIDITGGTSQPRPDAVAFSAGAHGQYASPGETPDDPDGPDSEPPSQAEEENEPSPVEFPAEALILGLPLIYAGRRGGWIRRCVPRAKRAKKS